MYDMKHKLKFKEVNSFDFNFNQSLLRDIQYYRNGQSGRGLVICNEPHSPYQKSMTRKSCDAIYKGPRKLIGQNLLGYAWYINLKRACEI